jgi:uncharacterized membrane protein
MMDFSLQLVVVLASVGGFWLAAHVWKTKQKKQPMVCPLHANCDTVVHSEFSKFLGLPVEWLGMAYYGLVAAGYVIFGWMLSGGYGVYPYGLLILSTGAFLFSVYLTFIQIFNLRQYCSWCLLSAALSTIIFLAALAGWQQEVVPVLGQFKLPFLMMHLLGVALGLGGAIIADVFFFRFLKDFRISHEEAATLNVLSQVVWLALALIVVSGVGLYLPQAEVLNESGKFLMKMGMVGILIVNGSLLNLLIAPKLVHISFAEPHHHLPGELGRMRRLAFALGAVSFVSWIGAFLTAMLPRETSGTLIALTYGAILISAVTMSQIVESRIGR